MQMKQLTNNGLTTFKEELDRLIDNCESFSIGAAFIDKTGIHLLRRFLHRRHSSNRDGRILTGLLGRFNTRANLKELRQLVLGHSGRLQAATSRTEHFHWKFYAFYFKRYVVVYMGSANFTKAGMTSTGEWMTCITADRTRDRRIIERWERIFATEWDDAIPMKEFPLRWYKEIPTKGSGAAATGLHPTIKALLKQPKNPAESSTEPDRIRVLLLRGRLSARTVSTVKRYRSEWERKNWEYFSCETKAGFDADRSATHFILVWKEAIAIHFIL